MNAGSKLRRQYGLRLIKEPLATTVTVPAKTRLSSGSDVFAMMQPFAAQEVAETFWALPLDIQMQCVAPVAITRGILNSSLVHPRETFRAMICANAAAIVLCHNHPSGDPTPSPDDLAVTAQHLAAGRLLDLQVVDHVIIGDPSYFSFRESGLL